MKAPITETLLRDFLLDITKHGNFELTQSNGLEIGLTKVPSHTFNWIFALEKLSSEQLAQTKSVIENLRQQQIPALFMVGSVAQGDELKKLLAEQDIHDPMYVECMSFELDKFDIKNYQINSSVEVKEISTDKEFDDWCEISAIAFNHDVASAKKVLKPSLKKPNFHFLVTYKDQKPIGECVLYLNGENAACHWGSVHPDFRKQGIATTAVLKRLQMAKELGCKQIVVECFPASAGLFKRVGFKVISAIDMYVI